MSELPPAYSYLRYSSDPQGEGDSTRRQKSGPVAWCKRNGRVLDTSLTFEDRGTSAFRGRHRKDGSPLAQFLADVQSGRIVKGSVLIIENLDRLSRENPWDAVPLLCSIVNAGITVVTLSPSEVTYERGRDLTPLVLACVEFGRSHSESASKSDRLSAVWGNKQAKAREGNGIVTRRLPAWVEEQGGKLVAVPERVKVVRRIFELAVNGYGLSRIVGRLVAEKVPAWGLLPTPRQVEKWRETLDRAPTAEELASLEKPGRWRWDRDRRPVAWTPSAWSKAYVHKIISGRVVLGEYQPKVNDKADGKPVLAYYPAIIDEATWIRAQAALAQRKDKTGPVGEKVATVFSGLLFDAATRSRMLIAWQTQGQPGQRTRSRILRSADSMEGRAACVSFPYEVFEAAVLSRLEEITPADVVGKEEQGEASVLAAELAAHDLRMGQVEAEIEAGGDVPALARILRKMDETRRDLAGRLLAARQKEANPTGATWAEARTLLSVAQDEHHRLRLRALLQAALSDVWVLVVARRSYRFCACQFNFASGVRRSYLILYQSAGNGRKGGLLGEPKSVAEVVGADTLDLRNREDVAALTEALEAIDPAALAG